ncbi:hypothetical protein [Collimonas pratensis]|uniref:Lipoprotein n=1 Tax=Collimonas pratensis TaxID=279113 RepID=A0A127Q200_9BURK|nr:hypothetical protein [Collimonas pratensis]AMP03845.1 hypothetical protein CPter91_1465 [Collimonas pratensis]
MRFRSYSLPRLSFIVLLAFACISGNVVLAAEQPANAGWPLHFNVAGGRNSFNSLPATARRDLLIPPATESESQPKHARRDWNGDRGHNCESLEQQYRGALYREPMIPADFYPNADLSRTYPSESYRSPNGPRPGVPNPDNAQRNGTWLESLLSPGSVTPLSERERLRAHYDRTCVK